MDHGRMGACSVLVMAGLGFGTLRGGNVPAKAARGMASVPLARGLSRVAHPVAPGVLVRRTLAAYGPIQRPGQDDPAFGRHGGVRLLKALDLGVAAQPEPAPETAVERPPAEQEPVDPGQRAHVRAVALAGNFANWVRRSLQACDEEGGSHLACEKLLGQLEGDGELFRLYLDVEIAANKALLNLAAGAGHESGLRVANARLEAALDHWRTHVVPLMEGLGEEHRAPGGPPPDGEKSHGAGFPDEDPREPHLW